MLRRTGGKDARQFPVLLARRSQTLRDLRRKIWPHPALLLPDPTLLKEVRGPLQGPPGGRPQMVEPASGRRLMTATASTRANFINHRFRARRLSVIPNVFDLYDAVFCTAPGGAS